MTWHGIEYVLFERKEKLINADALQMCWLDVFRKMSIGLSNTHVFIVDWYL